MRSLPNCRAGSSDPAAVDVAAASEDAALQESRVTRRAFLAAALAALLLPSRGRASEFNRFRVAQATVGGRAPARPDAAFVLGQEVRFRTAVEVKLDRVVVPLGSRALFDHPFVIWVGEDAVELDARERANLAAYLRAGGFLLVDNAGEGPGLAAFDRSFRGEMRRAFPGRTLATVPDAHVVRRAFYKLASVAGRRAVRDDLEGFFLEDRLALVYSQNDLSGAWSRDGFGNWQFEAVPGGPAQREGALRLGVNLVLYALLLDYKDEQAHVEHLLRRRRLRPGDPER